MHAAEYHKRFEQALASETPAENLYQLAHALRNEGMAQIDLYLLFSHYQEKTSGDDPLYDAIVDPMDAIHGGPWAKGCDLYATPLTSEIINTALSQRACDDEKRG